MAVRTGNPAATESRSRPAQDADPAPAPPDPVDDEYPEYQPPPYLYGPPLSERVARVWGELTRTPGRAALTVLAALAVVVAALALIPVTVVSADSVGPYRASCGIGYYVAGYPTAGVAAACHSAYGGHAAAFFVAVLVLLASSISLAVLVAAGRAPEEAPNRAARALVSVRRLWATPARAAVLTADAVAFTAAVVALRTVSIPAADSQGPLVAHCGISYYVFGTSNAVVQKACRGVYGAHAAVFFLAAGLFVIGVLVLRRLPDATGSATPAAD
jgi:hypothetical protein